MPAAVQPTLQSGRVYRTHQLGKFTTNPSRLAKRLVAQGELWPVGRGLYARLAKSKFGPVPPSREELMRRFLNSGRFLFTGSEKWNALGLGSTAVFATPLVYNATRSGEFELGGRRFILRRVAFPEEPTPEYYVVDLIKNRQSAGVSLDQLQQRLSRAVAEGRFKKSGLRRCAREYGNKTAETLVENAIASTKVAP